MDTRYQFQPRHVQIYRWLRYKPLGLVAGLYYCAMWLLFCRTLPKFPERSAYPLSADTPEVKYIYPHRTWAEYLKFIIKINLSVAGVKMQHTWTLQEVMARIKVKD